VLAGDGHDIRTQPMPQGVTRYVFEESLGHWAKANGCALESPESCPSPIIVSAAGGASRASFLVGGLLGKLIDERTTADQRPLRPFETQLFAISGVSGGSVGAVMTYAALADRRGGQGSAASLPPCEEKAAREDDQWFRWSGGPVAPAQ